MNLPSIFSAPFIRNLPQSRVYSLPMTGLLATLILLIFITCQTFSLALFTPIFFPQLIPQNIGYLIEFGSDNGTVMSWAIIFTLVVIIATVSLIITLLKGSQLKAYLAIRSFRFKDFAIFTGWLILLNIFIEIMSHLLDLQPMQFLDKLYLTAHPVWLLAFAMVVCAATYEEVMFRGFMWTGLAKSPLGFWGATLITSAIFASIHLQYGTMEMLGVFLLAVLFSFARAKSGSLLLPIVLHILNNGWAMGTYILGHG